METIPGTRRGRAVVVAVLTALLAGALTFLLPTLVAGADEATLAGALLAVAVAALVGAAHESADLATRGTSERPLSRRPVPLVLATRATDPTHHPLRPRAPGIG